MTLGERLTRGAGEPSMVVSAADLLAAFNDAAVLAPLDVLAATTIARVGREADERVALAAALAVRGTRFGHVCIRLPRLREAVMVDGQDAEVVEGLPWPDPEEWMAALSASPLVGDGTGEEPLVLAGDRLYLERYFRYEEQLAALLDARSRRPATPLPAETRRMLTRLLPPDAEGLPTSQHRAVETAVTSSVAVIAGGPGTGKTYTVGVLLAALASDPARPFPRVALCAPTGKAAARLGEAVAELADRIDDPAVAETVRGVEASTIHRLLGWTRGRGRFAHDAQARLPHDLVVVDEMSMVSLPLAAKLLAAVRPDAAVVLVGDPFQLESIEAGTVLADIVAPAAGPWPAETAPLSEHVVVLDRSYRFDGALAELADAVRGGDGDTAMSLLQHGHDALRWVPDRSDPNFAGMWARLLRERVRMVELGSTPGQHPAALKALSAMAVLCARREGPESVTRWRGDIESALDERFVGLRYGGEWYPGRPLMITRNDYNLGLYNGDIGVAVDTEHGLQAAFERGGFRLFPLSHLGQHTTVHAMTIHKSQGSQFGEVMVALPAEASRFLTRELLYTAVTRATERVWVVGEEAVIRQAISRSVQRASGLGDRLWRGSAGKTAVEVGEE